MIRLGLLVAGGLALLSATSALANTINFGAPSNSSSCALSGLAGDRSCTNAASITNGVNDATASASVVGQASADQGLSTDPTAIADITVSYQIPYTVTRTVSINGPGNPLNASVPIQTISFSINTTGEVSKDNSQVGGGLGQALYTSGSVSSLSGYFASQAIDGTISQTGGGGLVRQTLNNNNNPSYGTSVNFSGPAVGEVSFVFQVPTDYRLWQDFTAPGVTTDGSTWQQSLTDTLVVSFRLRAESRASGSISTTGGEALACFGQTSPLGSFTLDNAASCGSGVQITATTAVSGTSEIPVPEPTTLLLLGGGLAGIAYAARRKLS